MATKLLNIYLDLFKNIPFYFTNAGCKQYLLSDSSPIEEPNYHHGDLKAIGSQLSFEFELIKCTLTKITDTEVRITMSAKEDVHVHVSASYYEDYAVNSVKYNIDITDTELELNKVLITNIKRVEALVKQNNNHVYRITASGNDDYSDSYVIIKREV